MQLKVKKLSDKATVPTRGSEHAAGYDLYSTEDYILRPGESKLFKTNISVVIPEGYYGRIAGRSGLAYKNGIDILGGVIDSDYRGDVGVILLNTISLEFNLGVGYQLNFLKVTKGDRIAQLVIEKYYSPEIVEVENLDDSIRGEKGWGSTGK